MTKRSLLALALFAAAALPLHAGFDDVAHAVGREHGLHRRWIPFLGLARVAVWMVDPAGVHDFQLVTYEGGGEADPQRLRDIMRTKVGPGFSPLVQTWSRRTGEWSFIYAKPSPNGKRIDLMVLAHDDEDTVLVRVEVDTDAVARELARSPREVVTEVRDTVPH
ncbi:MAG: hypothetical protein JO197_21525 [Acidobacteria bacterium]|nr:hypothetical protein [Acidobacteriota bacterium]MBV9475470.1 hypothetical protein [Acidobacteriota bacterium]